MIPKAELLDRRTMSRQVGAVYVSNPFPAVKELLRKTPDLFPRISSDPTLARCVPFAIFLGLTFCQGMFGEASRYWVYFLKTVVGAWMVWQLRASVAEMRWLCSWSALGSGIAVLLLWVGLDGFYPSLNETVEKSVGPLLDRLGLGKVFSITSTSEPDWNPIAYFKSNPTLGWGMVAIRIVGSSLVVPPLEETFYRSFLYRYLIRPEFQTVPLRTFRFWPFLITSVLFGVSHHEWLAGILCGLIYQALLCWRGRLGDAMTAHATTNFLLGLWVVWKGAWHFW